MEVSKPRRMLLFSQFLFNIKYNQIEQLEKWIEIVHGKVGSSAIKAKQNYSTKIGLCTKRITKKKKR